jgi:hypothetical protein
VIILKISEIRNKVNDAIFMFKISKTNFPNKLIVDDKTYKIIKSYIGVVKNKEYFNDLEIVIDNSVKEFKVDYRED